MPDPSSSRAAAIRETVQRYLKLMNDGDADAIADLYSENGSVEDPVGAPPREGRETVRAFYRKSAGAAQVELTGPIRVCGDEAAFPLLGRIGKPEDPVYLDIIDVMKFDDQGRILSMRAFWSADGIRKG